MKKTLSIRLDDDLMEYLEKKSAITGKTKTEIIEEALKCLQSSEENREYNEEDKGVKTQIELLERQNFQLQNVIKSLQIALDSKDQVIEEKERMIEKIEKEKQERLKEKDERIKELKQVIEFMSRQNKKWWKFWE